MDSIDSTLLDYYQRELAYLRHAGGQFAKLYPKVAHRLALSDGECPDPHIERLLESFALLCARLQRQLDDQYADFSNALLEQLYPYAQRPMPSCVTVQFVPDPKQGNLNEGYTLPRDTPLFVSTLKGDTLHFRTTSALTLWPLSISNVTLVTSETAKSLSGHNMVNSALLLTLKAYQTLDNLSLKQLRIHLAGSPINAAALYDLLAAHTLHIGVRVPGKPWQWQNGLPEPVGFLPEESLLPHEAGQHPAHRLLVEYFAFPEKFFYFDLPLTIPPQSSDCIEVIITFKQAPDARVSVHRGDLLLGCVPVINLFPRTSEPLNPTGTQSEYHVIADMHRAHAEEIYSIRKLYRTTTSESVEIPAYFSCQHHQLADSPLYWYARRVQSSTYSGSEMLLTLTDTNFTRNTTLDYRLTAELLCTNRQLASELPAGGHLIFEQGGPVAQVVLVRTPSTQTLPELEGSSRWKLISQLSLNHLSISEGPQALEALKEILEVHNLTRITASQRIIAGIKQLPSKRIMDHLGQDAWRGWRNGLDIRIELDDSHFVGYSPVLFSGLLAHFFTLYATPNRFVRTTLIRAEQEIKIWQPSSEPLLVL